MEVLNRRNWIMSRLVHYFITCFNFRQICWHRQGPEARGVKRNPWLPPRAIAKYAPITKETWNLVVMPTTKYRASSKTRYMKEVAMMKFIWYAEDEWRIWIRRGEKMNCLLGGSKSILNAALAHILNYAGSEQPRFLLSPKCARGARPSTCQFRPFLDRLNETDRLFAVGDGIGRDRYERWKRAHERNIFSIVLYITKLNSEPIQYLV